MHYKESDFKYTTDGIPHVDRARHMLTQHPEIRDLMGRNRNSFIYIVLLVTFQVTMAFYTSRLDWWMIAIIAYVVGAFANHALFVMIHECTHNLIFKSKLANIWTGIFCDMANAFPTSTEFSRYHLKHHAYMGHHDIDADIPSRWEAELIGDHPVKKSLWLLFFPFMQISRKFRLKEIQLFNRWSMINLVTIVLFDIAIIYFWGPKAFLYLICSLLFSVGLHPLGARWIQEHYLVNYPQETYSYYGPLNRLAFNVGYHNEHHDFAFIPWNNLPKLKKIAPEFYDNLYAHHSWTKLLWMWIRLGDLNLFSRILRITSEGETVSLNIEDKRKIDNLRHALNH